MIEDQKWNQLEHHQKCFEIGCKGKYFHAYAFICPYRIFQRNIWNAWVRDYCNCKKVNTSIVFYHDWQLQQDSWGYCMAQSVVWIIINVNITFLILKSSSTYYEMLILQDQNMLLIWGWRHFMANTDAFQI